MWLELVSSEFLHHLIEASHPLETKAYSLFKGEVTESPRGKVSCPRSHWQ